MQQKLREYIDALFQEAPKTKKTVEVMEEILQNLIDKYNDLIEEGKSQEAAYNIAIASIGDISELINELKENHMNTNTNQFDEKLKNEKKKSALITSSAVGLYILCIIPPIIFDDDKIGPILMFILAAIATSLLIYNRMTSISYQKTDDTIAEEFREWRATTNERHQVFKSIQSAIWSLITVIYFVLSFTTGAWHITWVIFLIGTAVSNIVKAVYDLKR